MVLIFSQKNQKRSGILFHTTDSSESGDVNVASAQDFFFSTVTFKEVFMNVAVYHRPR